VLDLGREQSAKVSLPGWEVLLCWELNKFQTAAQRADWELRETLEMLLSTVSALWWCVSDDERGPAVMWHEPRSWCRHAKLRRAILELVTSKTGTWTHDRVRRLWVKLAGKVEKEKPGRGGQVDVEGGPRVES
jgi:hypothetical protein